MSHEFAIIAAYRRHKAAAFSAMLLVTAAALASLMTGGRGTITSLDRAIQPEGWGVTFKVPQDWEVSSGTLHGVRDCVVFTEPKTDAGRRLLFIGRRQLPSRVDADNPERLQAAAFLQDVEYQGILGMLVAPRFQQVPGTESYSSFVMQDLRRGSLAVATILPDGWSYCVVMTFEGVDPAPSDLLFLDQMIGSVESLE